MSPHVPDDPAEAVRLLYRQQGETVYRTIFAMTLDAELTRDLTHETFVRAYGARDELAELGALEARPWLLRIATSLALTQYRVQQRQSGTGRRARQEQDEEKPPPDQDLAAWVMGALNPEQRALVTLHHCQQVPRAEIAADLGIPARLVAARLSRAMQVVRRRAHEAWAVPAEEEPVE